ncbi:unnamed protein product [Acanthoscelides obtectus]|uniref:Uncharacterized protein n=1 Tax=Acanthoscelides obtectus TaxID=200917 RepID=A0A9P0K6E0_ACAOB|nr:unnamed protein product [Acanthoscelides obtectus]CAK1649344.1 hypothetical protein AOBTE_LOCUS16175 [Acanthoscelides obtectus]
MFPPQEPIPTSQERIEKKAETGILQSDPAHPCMHTHLYSPSSKVHCPWPEQPFSQPAVKEKVC